MSAGFGWLLLRQEKQRKLDESRAKRRAQRDAREAAEAKARELQMQKELQLRADKALLATYLSVEEIVMHRDRRIELFQAQSRVTELYLRNLEARLQKLRSDASRYQPYNTDSNAPMIEFWH